MHPSFNLPPFPALFLPLFVADMYLPQSHSFFAFWTRWVLGHCPWHTELSVSLNLRCAVHDVSVRQRKKCAVHGGEFKQPLKGIICLRCSLSLLCP